VRRAQRRGWGYQFEGELRMPRPVKVSHPWGEVPAHELCNAQPKVGVAGYCSAQPRDLTMPVCIARPRHACMG